MSDDFDPYWAWLGIPPGIRPPSQPDLLGISSHETSPETIAQAADRRMAVVSAMLVTPHAAWAQRLLVEVATARAMLLAGLGSRTAAGPSAAQAATVAAVPAPQTPTATPASADDDLLPPVALDSQADSNAPAGYPAGIASASYPALQSQYAPQPVGYAYPVYAGPVQPYSGYGAAAAAAAGPAGYAPAQAVPAANLAPGGGVEAAPASVPGAGGYRSVASAARRRSRSSFNLTVIGGLAVICVVIVAVILGNLGGDQPSSVSQAPAPPPAEDPADGSAADSSNDELETDAPPEESEPPPPRDPATIRPRVVRSEDPDPAAEPVPEPTEDVPDESPDEMPADADAPDEMPEEEPPAGEMPLESTEPPAAEGADTTPEGTEPSEPAGDEPNPDEPLPDNPDEPAPDPAGEMPPDEPADTAPPTEPSETTPEPEPAPEPEPMPEASNREVQLVDRALIAFRANLESREFEAAAEKLDEALLEVTDPALSARLDRAQSCLYYLREFWEAVARSVAELKGGQELTLNDEIIIVVEVQPDLLIIRAAGMNRRYRIRQIPPALAYQLADTWLADDNPASQVFLAAFLALDGKGDPDRARTMLQAAARDGMENEVQPLLEALDGKL